MGTIVKQVSENTTRYYWYPGDKKEWIRAGVALAAGGAVFAVAGAGTRNVLTATVCGTSTLAVVAGVNFGRRDARALAGFPDLNEKAARRAAVVHTGRAIWRAFAEGVGGASAAVLIANLPYHGFAANWGLPLVPAVAGALAHQGGMLYERVTTAPKPAAAAATEPAATGPAIGRAPVAAPAGVPVAAPSALAGEVRIAGIR